MQDKLTLTIALTSLAALGIATAALADTTTTAPVSAPKAGANHGGKCASGKCGTEKIYGKANIEHDPNGALVRARDGKCGPSGKGHAVPEDPRDKLATGVCGQ
jgi:uncharacterized low-complexity protein